jgi:hypothetical protein
VKVSAIVCVLALLASAAQADPTPDPSLKAKAVSASPAKPVLMMRGLDKITGRAFDIAAPLNVPVKFATLTITARYCYSTPSSETPETAAFVQIEDARPDKPKKQVFSGWMYASSPGLNGMQHPLYDVWAIFCRTNAPGTAAPVIASRAPVKVKSPDAADNEAATPLPEGADQ